MAKRPVTDRYRLLEMALRDGLENLQDFTMMMASRTNVSNLEILSVSPDKAKDVRPVSYVTRIDNLPDNVIHLEEALERRLKKRTK